MLVHKAIAVEYVVAIMHYKNAELEMASGHLMEWSWLRRQMLMEPQLLCAILPISPALLYW